MGVNLTYFKIIKTHSTVVCSTFYTTPCFRQFVAFKKISQTVYIFLHPWCRLWTFDCRLCTVECLGHWNVSWWGLLEPFMSTVYSVQSTVYNILCTLYTVSCTVYTIHCTLYVYTLQRTVESVQCTMHSVQYILALYSLHCKLYSVHYTVPWCGAELGFIISPGPGGDGGQWPLASQT